MKTIDKFTAVSQIVYMLHQDNDGDFVITDSDGGYYKMVGLAEAEALTIWHDEYLEKHLTQMEHRYIPN